MVTLAMLRQIILLLGPVKYHHWTLLASALFTLNRRFDTFFCEHHVGHWWWPLTEKLSDDCVPILPSREVEISFGFCANSACRTKREIKKINQCNLNKILSYIFVEFLTENILSIAKSETVLFFFTIICFYSLTVSHMNIIHCPFAFFHPLHWLNTFFPTLLSCFCVLFWSTEVGLAGVSMVYGFLLNKATYQVATPLKKMTPTNHSYSLLGRSKASRTPPPLVVECWQAHLMQVATVAIVPKCHARRRVEPWFSSPQQTKGYGMLQPLSHGSTCLWESLASGGSPGWVPHVPFSSLLDRHVLKEEMFMGVLGKPPSQYCFWACSQHSKTFHVSWHLKWTWVLPIYLNICPNTLIGNGVGQLEGKAVSLGYFSCLDALEWNGDIRLEGQAGLRKWCETHYFPQ